MPDSVEEQSEQLKQAAITLTSNIRELRETVEVARTLRDDLVKLQTQGNKNRLLINVVSGGLLLDLVLTIFSAGLFFHQKDQNNQIKSSQHAISANQQNVTKAVQSQSTAGAADCRFFYDFGTITLAKNSSTVGFQIVADSRNAYVGHNCLKVKGKLPKADPRLLPYLDPQAR